MVALLYDGRSGEYQIDVDDDHITWSHLTKFLACGRTLPLLIESSCPALWNPSKCGERSHQHMQMELGMTYWREGRRQLRIHTPISTSDPQTSWGFAWSILLRRPDSYLGAAFDHHPSASLSTFPPHPPFSASYLCTSNLHKNLRHFDVSLTQTWTVFTSNPQYCLHLNHHFLQNSLTWYKPPSMSWMLGFSVHKGFWNHYISASVLLDSQVSTDSCDFER